MEKIKQIQQKIEELNNLVLHHSTKKISFSQFQLYSNCEYQWYLSYVQKEGYQSPNINMVFGTTFHNTIQQYLKLYFDNQHTNFNWELFYQEKYSEEYQKQFENNKDTHFSSAKELDEFYNDGKTLLSYIIENIKSLFNNKEYKLVGIEIPIIHKIKDETYFRGFIDICLYHIKSGTYMLYDIKTSRSGWTDSQKKDGTKISQLILYKKYFAEQYNIPIENIKTEYFIVRRKTYKTQYGTTKPVQSFTPADGKNTLNKVTKNFNKFLDESLINPKDKYFKNKESCKYCPFTKNTELCDKKN